MTVEADGTWEATIADGDIPEGESTVKVEATATDAAGNTKTYTQDINIDTIAPTLVIQSVESDGGDGDGVINDN